MYIGALIHSTDTPTALLFFIPFSLATPPTEHTMLYALTGTEAPGRWYMVVPGILSAGQENVLLADLNRAAPDYILLTGRSTYEYGAAYFGIDYDQRIYHWIESNYRVAGQFGRFRRERREITLAALLYEKEAPGHADRSR